MRNALTAAAAVGGVLALTIPATALMKDGLANPADAAALRLAADVRIEDRAAPGPDRIPVAIGQPAARFVPVAHTVEPTAPTVDAAELLKAAGLADLVRRAEEERAARDAAARCNADLDGIGRVKPWVADAARFLSCLYDSPHLIGMANRARASDHPTGHALDLMVRGDQGDRIADCALANAEALGITYVIWEQRVNYGDGWERMGDRGGDTANHYDHVHISFAKSAPDGDPTATACS